MISNFNTGKQFKVARSSDEFESTWTEFETEFTEVISEFSKDEKPRFLNELYSLIVLSEFPKKNFEHIKIANAAISPKISKYFELTFHSKGEEIERIQPLLFSQYSDYRKFILYAARLINSARSDKSSETNSYSFQSMLIIREAVFFKFITSQLQESTPTDVAAIIIALFKQEIINKDHLKNIKKLRQSLLEISIPKSAIGSYAFFSKKLKLYKDDAELKNDNDLMKQVKVHMKQIESKLIEINSSK